MTRPAPNAYSQARCYMVSEASLPRLLWDCLWGRPVFIISLLPLLKGSSSLLTRTVAWLERMGYAKPLVDFSPDLPWIESFPGDGYYNDILERVEDRLRVLFNWSGLPDALKPFAYMMRKSVTDYLLAVQPPLLFAAWAEKNAPVQSWRLVGVPPFYRLVEALLRSQSLPGLPGRRVTAYLWNMANAAIVSLSGLFWLVRRVRRHIEPETFRVALDIVGRIELDCLLPDLIDDPKEALIVFRAREFQANQFKNYAAYRQCMIDDARTKPLFALSLLALLTRRLLALLVSQGHQDPELFQRMSGLLYKSLQYAAFFHRFRPATFWCRDDYSLEHGVRSLELRKIGAKSIGINHGLPLKTFAPQWREIDFDIYYVFGRHLYERHYKDSWPAEMQVRAIGNMRFTAQHRKLCQRAKSRDVVFFPIVWHEFDLVCRQIWEAARLLPDRRFLVKPKRRRGDAFLIKLDRLLTEAPANVVSLSEDTSPYDLLADVSYAVTTGSTLTAESLQAGVMPFVFDLDPKLTHFYYREFPTMIVKSGKELADRIRAVEAGEEIFDPAMYEELIAVSVEDPVAVIRQDIGLPPRKARKN